MRANVAGRGMAELFRAFGAKRVFGGFDPGVARRALTPGYYLERLRRTFALRAHCRQDACAPSEPPANAGGSDSYSSASVGVAAGRGRAGGTARSVLSESKFSAALKIRKKLPCV